MHAVSRVMLRAYDSGLAWSRLRQRHNIGTLAYELLGVALVVLFIGIWSASTFIIVFGAVTTIAAYVVGLRNLHRVGTILREWRKNL